MAKRIAEQAADWLVRQGVEQVFAVTGGGAMFLNQALGSHPGLRCTFMHHEQACAMAAEGYARVSGKPAVVMLTTGPGAINALNGVYGAFTDSIPIIVLSGQIKRETCLDFNPVPGLRQLGDQEARTVEMASPVCKFARLVRTEADLASLLPEAFHLAVTGRPGPVWLDFPLDIQQSTVAVEIPDLPPNGDCGPEGQAAIREAAREIVGKLLGGHRPLLLAGTGVRLSSTQVQLLTLAERFGLPVATAWTHDIIASDHPLFAGRPGTIGTRPGNFCLQAADVVVVLGSRLNIRQTSYNFAAFAKNAWVAQVDIDSAELSKPTYSPDFAVAADLRDFLAVFEEELSNAGLPSYAPWADWCRRMQVTYDAADEHQQDPEGPLNPYVVVDTIFRHLRPDDIVVCGNASACILPFQVGRLQAGQRLFSNSGSASMGYDLPAALGAAVAARAEGRRRVVCFAGDGSLQMNIQELQTLKTHGWDVLIVVLNNGGYLSIRQTHENFFGRVIGATPESGIEFPAFSAVARAYGLSAETVDDQDGLSRLPKLLEADGPRLIDIRVNPKQEFAPRIKSRVDESGRFVTPELDDMHPFLETDALEAVRRESALIRAQPPAFARGGL